MKDTFGATLLFATDIYRAKFRERVPGLTLTQLLILDAIADGPPITQTEIVRRSGIDRSTLSSTLRYLSRDGYVTVSGSKEDIRANVVALTAPGKRVRNAALAAIERLESGALQLGRAKSLLAEAAREIAQVTILQKPKRGKVNVGLENALGALGDAC